MQAHSKALTLHRMLRVFALFFVLTPLLSFGNKLEAYFSYCSFYSPGIGSYVETYLTVAGNSVKYKQNDNGMYQASINVTYIFRTGDQVKTFKKYNFLSPEIPDTTESLVNFMDQQRITVPDGKYLLDIEIQDANAGTTPFSTTQPLEVFYPRKSLLISDIELVERFEKAEEASMITKSGYNIIPYVSNYFPEDEKKLKFYVEIYNAAQILGQDEPYLLKYFIRNYETKAPLSQCTGFKRQSASEVSVFMKEFMIHKLPSGNYELVVEVRDRNNKLLAEQKLFFQRSNPSVKISVSDLNNLEITNSFVETIPWDSLDYYINALYPISDPLEMSFISDDLEKIEDPDTKKKFLLSFWVKRNQLEPEASWQEYRDKVKQVERRFSTSIKNGFETDRGRIYLKYGSPNSIVERKREPNAYPYEIWHYYQIAVRSDARFVFYNPDLISNDYELLHSNVYTEIRDYRWQQKLYKRTDQMPNVDQTDPLDHSGRWSDDLFNIPR